MALPTSQFVTGQEGTLKVGASEVNEISNWQITKTATTSRFATNKSGGWKRTVAGSKDWTASFDLKLVAGQAIPVKVGEAYIITFHINDSTDYYIGRGVIANDELECNVDEGTEITIPISVEGDGPLERAGTLLADVDQYAS